MIILNFKCDNCKTETKNQDEIIGISLECDIRKPINKQYECKMNNPEKYKVHFCLECYRMNVTVSALNAIKRPWLDPNIKDVGLQRKDLERRLVAYNSELKAEEESRAFLLRRKLVAEYQAGLRPGQRKPMQSALFG